MTTKNRVIYFSIALIVIGIVMVFGFGELLMGGIFIGSGSGQLLGVGDIRE